MKSKNAQLYENVIIRNNQEIGINNYGLDYLVELEQRIYKAIKYIKKNIIFDTEQPHYKAIIIPIELLEILGDKEDE